MYSSIQISFARSVEAVRSKKTLGEWLEDAIEEKVEREEALNRRDPWQ